MYTLSWSCQHHTQRQHSTDGNSANIISCKVGQFPLHENDVHYSSICLATRTGAPLLQGVLSCCRPLFSQLKCREWSSSRKALGCLLIDVLSFTWTYWASFLWMTVNNTWRWSLFLQIWAGYYLQLVHHGVARCPKQLIECPLFRKSARTRMVNALTTSIEDK